MASRDPYARNRKRSVALRTAEARAARRLRALPVDLLDPITPPNFEESA